MDRTLTESDTEKREATVKFAKAMGWGHRCDRDDELVDGWPCYGYNTDEFIVWRVRNAIGLPWDPWTNLADAVELADRLGIYYRRDYYQVPERQFAAWRQWHPPNARYPCDSEKSDEVRGGALCEAICRAATSHPRGDE